MHEKMIKNPTEALKLVIEDVDNLEDVDFEIFFPALYYRIKKFMDKYYEGIAYLPSQAKGSKDLIEAMEKCSDASDTKIYFEDLLKEKVSGFILTLTDKNLSNKAIQDIRDYYLYKVYQYQKLDCEPDVGKLNSGKTMKNEFLKEAAEWQKNEKAKSEYKAYLDYVQSCSEIVGMFQKMTYDDVANMLDELQQKASLLHDEDDEYDDEEEDFNPSDGGMESNSYEEMCTKTYSIRVDPKDFEEFENNK